MIFPMDVQFTDEELLALPANSLTRSERSRRRRVRRRLKEAKEQERKARQIANEPHRTGTPKKKVTPANRCHGSNKAGNPCGAPAVKGAKHCLSHLNDAEKAKLGKKTFQESGTEGRRLRNRTGMNAPAMMRSVVEVAVEKLIMRYFAALGLEFIGYDDDGNPIVLDNGIERGICLHGESKEGDIVMTDYPDLAAQIQVMEKLMDRTYGKPKQTQILEGGQRPIKVQPVRSMERAQEVADLLQRVGAVHSRRQELEAAHEPIDIELSDHPAPESNGNVVPLKRGHDDVE